MPNLGYLFGSADSETDQTSEIGGFPFAAANQISIISKDNELLPEPLVAVARSANWRGAHRLAADTLRQSILSSPVGQESDFANLERGEQINTIDGTFDDEGRIVEGRRVLGLLENLGRELQNLDNVDFPWEPEQNAQGFPIMSAQPPIDLLGFRFRIPNKNDLSPINLIYTGGETDNRLSDLPQVAQNRTLLMTDPEQWHTIKEVNFINSIDPYFTSNMHAIFDPPLWNTEGGPIMQLTLDIQSVEWAAPLPEVREELLASDERL